MSISGDQVRMARAALKLTLRELEQMAEIDKSTIVRIENGGNAYALTLKQLRGVLETAGVEFLDPVEGISGAGGRPKWGVVVETRAGGDTDEVEVGTRRTK